MTRKEQIEQTAYRYATKRQEDPNYPVYNWKTEITDAFIEGAKYADEHPDLYSVTRKAVEREREYLIREACDWLRGSTILAETTIERFKKAMEEQQ